jgi:hypothetical protein
MGFHVCRVFLMCVAKKEKFVEMHVKHVKYKEIAGIKEKKHWADHYRSGKATKRVMPRLRRARRIEECFWAKRFSYHTVVKRGGCCVRGGSAAGGPAF